MRHPAFPLLSLLLAFGLGCGGGARPSGVSTAGLATGLTYVDPAGSGWRLVKDPASTPTRLVLDLVGPTGLKSRGAGFNLQGPAGVRFAAFSNGWPVEDAGVYELLNTDATGDPLEPALLAGGVKRGNLLTVGIFQKDRRATAKESGAPLCRIALELDPGTGLRAGDPLPLRITKSKYMAEDIGTFSITPTDEMAAKAHLVDMSLALGTLRAQ